MAVIVAVLFGVFGIQALRNQEDGEPNRVWEKPGHGIFFTKLFLLLVAEFGDKTQIAVAGWASNMAPIPVWIGAIIFLLFDLLATWKAIR